MNTPSQLLSLVGFASLNGALLIVILFLLRPWLRRLSGSQWVYNSWAIVLLRLFFLPVGLSWSVAGIWPQSAPVQEHGSPWKVEAHVQGITVEGNAGTEHLIVAPVPPVADWARLLLVAWGAGVIGMGAYFAGGAWRTRSICRRAPTADLAQLRTILGGLPEEMHSRIRVAITDEIPVAALAGILKPQVLLPREWLSKLDDGALRHVILHELGHIRRRDLIGQWLMAAALCLHWFNPLVWLASRQMRMDAELACDAWVLARVTEHEREAYGETLLRTSQLFRVPLRMLPAAIGMAASRDTLIARIRHVGRYQTKSRFREALGVSIAAAAVAILGTARIVAQAPDVAPTNPAPPVSTPAPAPAPPTSVPAKEQPQSETSIAVSPDQNAARAKGKPRRPPMIEIESRFIEVSETLALKLGLILPPKNSNSSIGGAAALPPLAVNSVLDDAAAAKLVKMLNETKGVDMLSAPRVTTKSGQQAVIEIIREFRYPTSFELEKEKGLFVPHDFETRNLGVTLKVEPVFSEEDNVIDLNLAPEVVELEGYVRSKDSQPVPLANGRSVGANMTLKDMSGTTIPKDTTLQPVFSSRKITTSVSMNQGSTILLGGLKRDDRMEGKPPITRILYILVTARVVDPFSGAPPAAASSSSAPLQNISAIVPPADAPPPALAPALTDDAIPEATPVTGKPGYVISPFAPKAGYIDVRGFPSGTEIKCPYSGRTMKIP